MAHSTGKKIVKVTERHYKGIYTCTKCGNKVSSLEDFCTTCSAPFTATRFNFQGRVLMTPEEIKKHANKGQKWFCRSCGSQNSKSFLKCPKCGAEKKTSVEERPVIQMTLEEVNTGPKEDEKKYVSSVFKVDEPETPKVALNKWHFASAIGIAFLILIGYFLLRTSEVKATMIGADWTRSISIEVYKTVHRQGEDLPFGARNVREVILTRDERRSREVPKEEVIPESCSTSYTDNGDGTLTETETCRGPYTRYFTETQYYTVEVEYSYYYYDIDVWEHARNVTTSGIRSEENPPIWGTYTLKCVGAIVGCERESGRTQTYTIIFQDKEDATKLYRHNVSEADWWQYRLERDYILVMNTLMGIVNDPLRHPGSTQE